MTIRYKDCDDISDIFLQFDHTVRELKSIGTTSEDLDIGCNLILTLPKSFNGLAKALETMDTTKFTIEFVKSRLLDERGKLGDLGGN